MTTINKHLCETCIAAALGGISDPTFTPPSFWKKERYWLVMDEMWDVLSVEPPTAEPITGHCDVCGIGPVYIQQMEMEVHDEIPRCDVCCVTADYLSTYGDGWCGECGCCEPHCQGWAGCPNISPEKMEPHDNHRLRMVTYGWPVTNVALECADCNSVLKDLEITTH